MKLALADIEAARRVIEGVVLRTPMLPAPKLSALTGADVFGLVASFLVCVYLVYALLRGENL